MTSADPAGHPIDTPPQPISNTAVYLWQSSPLECWAVLWQRVNNTWEIDQVPPKFLSQGA